MNEKLELKWIRKEKREPIEPRILLENPLLSNNSHESPNMLIHGDNLVALKSLESRYSNKVKCIYIDPPYNTGSAFEHYDDNVEHSIWLSLMRERLEILRGLLKNDGSIYIQIDDNEQAYLKILCDEIFGRKNFISTITVKMSTVSGVKTTHRDKTIIKEKEYILVYAKNVEYFKLNPQYIPLKYIDSEFQYFLDKKGSTDSKKWVVRKLADVLMENGLPSKISGIDLMKDDEMSRKLLIFIEKNRENIWRRAFIRNEYKKISQDNPNTIYLNYSGDKEHIYYRGREMFFIADKMHNCLTEEGYKYTISNLLADIWLDINTGKLFNEGGVEFRNSKKPEFLIARILDMSTSEGDLVLDSFLGSGTTCAVAHKMGRKWIGIEMGDHIYSHCKPRIDLVIAHEDTGGVSNIFEWNTGGYKFYELAPTLIKTDSFGQHIINPEYNAEMLASAVAIHEGYKYDPDSSCYWKQSNNESNSYLYVTTNHINKEVIDSILTEMKTDEYLVIVCKSFDSNSLLGVKNITIKKIPQSLLKNCEFGVDNYNLNIINPPVYEDEEEDYDND